MAPCHAIPKRTREPRNRTPARDPNFREAAAVNESTIPALGRPEWRVKPSATRGRARASGTPPPCDDPIDVVSSRSDRSVPFEARMRKGEATRRRIVAQTAGLLNTQGYRSTPVSEIMRVTGLRKGGIYRHFDSRTTLT